MKLEPRNCSMSASSGFIGKVRSAGSQDLAIKASRALSKRTPPAFVTAISFINLVIKYAGTQRLLFLVDRGNLSHVTQKEFDQYRPAPQLPYQREGSEVRPLSEKPKAQLARELGVRVGQLRTWRLEFEKEAVTGIATPDRSGAEDLEQLRRENAKLRMEIEILKKAAIYFAREAK